MRGLSRKAFLITFTLLGISIAVPSVAHWGNYSHHRRVVFESAMIHFSPQDSLRYATDEISISDSGRRIRSVQGFMPLTEPTRIVARVVMHPIPDSELTVHDPWDRAASVSLVQPGKPAVEILKFITAYGGKTALESDVSWLAPLLSKPAFVEGFVDTWSSPGWYIDFKLDSWKDDTADNPDWALPLFNEQAFTAELMAAGPRRIPVSIPPGLSRVKIQLAISGHCTDGRGADEFESKDNVLIVDGVEAYRFRPWRDDCRQFRDINPYCRRWSDGSWSSDYSRSGWCPGDLVEPMRFDLSKQLTAGDHVIEFAIEDIRPKDKDGNHGYWRVSALLLGWED